MQLYEAQVAGAVFDAGAAQRPTRPTALFARVAVSPLLAAVLEVELGRTHAQRMRLTHSPGSYKSRRLWISRHTRAAPCPSAKRLTNSIKRPAPGQRRLHPTRGAFVLKAGGPAKDRAFRHAALPNPSLLAAKNEQLHR